MIKKIIAASAALALLSHPVIGLTKDAVSPDHYVVSVAHPAYPKGSGPRVLIDEAHHNFSTMEGRLKAFADLLADDGARVAPLRQPLSAKSLAQADVLVICNALNEKNAREKKTEDKWELPAPEAFTDEEIKALDQWIKAGGSLLLIADHMPFPGAVEKLGSSLGVVMQDNFAFAADFTYKPGDMNLITFARDPARPDGDRLYWPPVVDGSKANERVPYVVTFTGSAFRMKPGVAFSPVMELGEGTKIAWPSNHIDISIKTPFAAGVGLYQGVVLPFGSGRVGVFGEAAMFSIAYAEWAHNYPMGFQNPKAQYNKRFILDLFHWLARRQ